MKFRLRSWPIDQIPLPCFKFRLQSWTREAFSTFHPTSAHLIGNYKIKIMLVFKLRLAGGFGSVLQVRSEQAQWQLRVAPYVVQT